MFWVRAALWVGLLVILAAACGKDSAVRVAERVLDDHRRKAAARPLPAAGSIRVRLLPSTPDAAEKGSLEIEWENGRYRETVTSAGATRVRGIQGGKAFFTDEDGVTRVGSEPMLAELVTRSYFWRRAYLFADRERARLGLGPTDERSASVRLRPRGGNEMLLSFERVSGSLQSVVSPRLRLDFESAARFRDLGAGGVIGQIAWTGLPTRRLPDPSVGGARGRFAQAPAEAEITEAADGISIGARIGGVAAALSVDAGQSGPLRLSPELARRAGLSGRRDVFGRLLGDGATLEIGSFTAPGLWYEIAEPGAPGIDAVAGATLYRETVVDIDPASRRLRLHDPARFAAPEGFGRNVLDDDGDVPVAILFRTGRPVRLRAGARDSSPLLLSPEAAAEFGADPKSRTLSGLVWGTLRLPPLPFRADDSRYDADWGNDGAIGFPLLLRFHTITDMPHRWIYVRGASAD